MRRNAILVAALVLLLLAPAAALPNSGTSVSGRNCQRGHSLQYSYSVTAPKTAKVGDTFTVSIEFKMGGDSKVRSAPRKVSATLDGSNVDVSGASQKLANKASWDVTATKAGTAKMSFSTEFFIDGRDFHSGYTATYKDSIDFTIDITAPAKPPAETQPPPAENPVPPANTSGQNQPPQNETIGGNLPANTTGGDNSSNVISTDNNTQEIVQEFEGEIPAEPNPTSWLLTRSAGLIAYLFLFLSVLTALLKKAQYATRLTVLFKYHHDISLLSLVLALFHGLSNIFDDYMWNLPLDKVFIPQFGSGNQNMIALGVIAFYFMLIVVATSIGKSAIKRMGFKKWKYVHMTSYIAFVFVFMHSIILGTDIKSGGPVAYLFWFSAFLIGLISIDLISQRFSRKKPAIS